MKLKIIKLLGKSSFVGIMSCLILVTFREQSQDYVSFKFVVYLGFVSAMFGMLYLTASLQYIGNRLPPSGFFERLEEKAPKFNLGKRVIIPKPNFKPTKRLSDSPMTVKEIIDLSNEHKKDNKS